MSNVYKSSNSSFLMIWDQGLATKKKQTFFTIDSEIAKKSIKVGE